MPATALAQVELSRADWVAPRRIDAANVVVAWYASAPDRLSAFFPSTTVFPHGGDPKGLWLYYRHPIHGVCAGIVEDAPIDWAAGTVELAAVGFAGTLAHRLTPAGSVQRADTAGGLATRMLSDSATDNPIGWEVEADEVPPYLDWEWRDEDCLAVLGSLASATGQEWRVKVSERKVITFEWRYRLGRDQRRKVLLCDGYGVGGRLDDSIANVVNAVRATANDARFEDAARLTVRDDDSVIAYGERWAARRYVEVGTKPTLEPKARADVTASSVPSQVPDLLIPHMDPRGLLIREGDTILAQSRAQGKRLEVRVMGREVNTATGLCRIVGKAVAA